MSLLDKLLGRAGAPKAALAAEAVEKLVEVVGVVVDRVRDRTEARERLARAARRGDLDFILDAVEFNRRRAENYAKTGK